MQLQSTYQKIIRDQTDDLSPEGTRYDIFVLQRNAMRTLGAHKDVAEERFVVPQLYGLMGNVLFKVQMNQQRHA